METFPCGVLLVNDVTPGLFVTLSSDPFHSNACGEVFEAFLEGFRKGQMIPDGEAIDGGDAVPLLESKNLEILGNFSQAEAPSAFSEIRAYDSNGIGKSGLTRFNPAKSFSPQGLDAGGLGVENFTKSSLEVDKWELPVDG